MLILTALLILLLLPTPLCFAWNGHEVTEGPLRVLVEEVPEVTAPAEPTAVTVKLMNQGATEVTGRLALRGLVDGWHAVGESDKPFRAGPGKTVALEFAIASNPPVFSALYPVHAYATFREGAVEKTAHAVRIFSVKLPPVQSSQGGGVFAVNSVPTDGALPLWLLGTQRVAWHYYDKPPVFEAPGWQGSNPQSRASMGVSSITRGDTRAALNMHPPWQPGGGTIFSDFLLKLPEQRPIKLVFANAVRDSSANEPLGDGVQFRVWAGLDRQGKDATLLYDKFTDAKRWVDGEADLSAFAGKTILLRLESHPGPNRNTTCDSSYWAEPTVLAGTGLRVGKLTAPTVEEVQSTASRAQAVLTGRERPDGVQTFLLGPSPAAEKAAVVVLPGQFGLLDGVVTLATAAGTASFRGFLVDLDDQPAGRWPSAFAFRELQVQGGGSTAARFVHRLEYQGTPAELTLTIRSEGPGLRVSASASKRLSSFSVGPWDRQAPRVYYGHGYCLVNPKAFRAGFGGHNLATSHVGCDFEGGLSVLQAVDNPPNYFDVNPGNRTYALNTDQDCTLTLVPGKSAFACAVAYRPLFDKQPAAGVRKLAGRMCFDIWGGRYADLADRMARMLKYGLTESFLTVHNWQRWGYDYRLPDIWPPNPRYGTVEDMRKIGAVCNPAGVPWGLHDNYIDLYPDCEGYSYEHVYFTRDGRPHPAWYNEGRDAQSYKFRPDHVLPFVQRNLKLVKDGVQPTHYFVDVFTSSGCMDWWDWQGNYHSGNETRKYWGEAFAYIREYLGNDAPTTSEAGHDQLIGYLDGADCQWLGLSPKPQRFWIRLDCQDWERVPWYDAVNHANFILHGVGYSGRYEGGRGRAAHGINSEDYLSAEVLSGHSLMTDAGSWGRDAVRKYYLAQGLSKQVALRAMTDVEFVGGDIHRQKVTWDNGTVAYVNRGATPWQVAGRTLPQYGFYVNGPDCTATVETRDGKWAESSVGADGWYCNARTYRADANRVLQIEPRLDNFRYADGKVNYDLVWDAKAPATTDLMVFTHFCSEKSKRRDKIAFQDDHAPQPGTSQWRGELRYQRTVALPSDAEGEYQIMVGLYGPGGRALLQGYPGGDSRILLGTLVVKRKAQGIASVDLLPPPAAKPRPPLPLNEPGTFIDFGFARTEGAFRVQKIENGLLVTPLPDSPRFELTLWLDKLVGAIPTVKAVSALSFDESVAPKSVNFGQRRSAVEFAHDGQAFAYRVRW